MYVHIFYYFLVLSITFLPGLYSSPVKSLTCNLYRYYISTANASVHTMFDCGLCLRTIRGEGSERRSMIMRTQRRRGSVAGSEPTGNGASEQESILRQHHRSGGSKVRLLDDCGRATDCRYIAPRLRNTYM